ncbi:MAG: hypothetical protein ABIH34_04355 [Nanoarchaeota archaeon]
MTFLGKMAEAGSAVYILPESQSHELIVKLAKELSGQSVCYISLNKTFSALSELFQKKKIDISKFLFIDTTSKLINYVVKKEKACQFISNPGNTAELFEAIDKALKHKVSYVIFDSLNVLLVYIKEIRLKEIITGLISKGKAADAKTVLIAVRKENEEGITKDISDAIEKVIEADEG